jgi:hypothetical protein
MNKISSHLNDQNDENDDFYHSRPEFSCFLAIPTIGDPPDQGNYTSAAEIDLPYIRHGPF